jgi:hypothetical protein
MEQVRIGSAIPGYLLFGHALRLWAVGTQIYLTTPFPRCIFGRVKISYRVTSIAVVLVVVGMIVVPGSLTVRPPALTTVSDGGISFNPCFGMWEQIGWLIRLSALVWIGTFLPSFVQGLRNRTMPRVAAVVSLIAFGLSLHNQVWRGAALRLECWHRFICCLGRGRGDDVPSPRGSTTSSHQTI